MFLTTICFKFVSLLNNLEQNHLIIGVNIQNVFNKNKAMMKQNNKLEGYVQNKSMIDKLEVVQQKMPSLFNVIQAFIIGIAKPTMAVRAGFYRATGGFFAHSNIPWFKIIVILAGVYILTYKNLNLNLNLNSPQTTTPNFNTISVAQSLSPVSIPTFDDAANKAYIEHFQEVAITEMNTFGIPASIKLGQALLESQAGKSTNALSLNNHFNLKCGGLEPVFCTETPNGMFHEFDNAWDGWRAHSQLLISGDYANLKANAGKNYKIWATGLKQLGYNPDKQYAEKLIGIIEHYELQNLDKQ